MAERPPTTELSAGQASADSFTRFMANLVAEYAVDFQFDSLSTVRLDLMMFSEGLPPPVPVTDCVRS